MRVCIFHELLGDTSSGMLRMLACLGWDKILFSPLITWRFPIILITYESMEKNVDYKWVFHLLFQHYLSVTSFLSFSSNTVCNTMIITFLIWMFKANLIVLNFYLESLTKCVHVNFRISSMCLSFHSNTCIIFKLCPLKGTGIKITVSNNG